MIKICLLCFQTETKSHSLKYGYFVVGAVPNISQTEQKSNSKKCHQEYLQRGFFGVLQMKITSFF
jgi:hypothetical protein